MATIFEQIFADIGDEQSLQANLSTFVHIRTSQILRRSRKGRTLVLLDELFRNGPSRGLSPAAYSMNYKAMCLTLATTHLGM